MAQLININYFHYNRNFFPLLKHFLNKIKYENKTKFIFNILTNPSYNQYFQEETKTIDFNCHIYNFNYGFNYPNKIAWSTSQSVPYSIKIDEDCFVSNHVFDYMIENIELLKDNDIQMMTGIVSNGIPTVDDFIENYLTDGQKDEIYKLFLGTEFDKSCNEINPYTDDSYLHLNEYTIKAETWNKDNFYQGVNKITHSYKGIHPARLNKQVQLRLLDFICENPNKFLTRNNYSVSEMNRPYFCDTFYAIETKKWYESNYQRSITGEPFSEIPLNEYRWKNDLKMLKINNGFVIHTLYNSVKNYKELEQEYYNKLCSELINE